QRYSWLTTDSIWSDGTPSFREGSDVHPYRSHYPAEPTAISAPLWATRNFGLSENQRNAFAFNPPARSAESSLHSQSSVSQSSDPSQQTVTKLSFRMMLRFSRSIIACEMESK